MPHVFFILALFFITVFVFQTNEHTIGATKPPPSVVKSNIVWLGFPIIERAEWPPEVDLAKNQRLVSAFLTQLQRQAVLLSAREEFGALTRDAFLDEPASEETIKVTNVNQFRSSNIRFIDRSQYIADLEKRSRNEFVTEWQNLGLTKSEPSPPTENTNLEAECAEIDKLLCTWALTPQFEAVRRTHSTIRQYGESLPLIKKLVRGYTQLQMLTNIAPRDSHRVFQARAILYAQRAVAKFGETPETFALRAAAWSLNNFHRIAREEFAAIPPEEWENADVWTRLAKAYCEYDFKAIAAMIETVDEETERPIAKLLYFFLLDYSQNHSMLARPFGEKAFADLPDCTRLYTGTFSYNTFDFVLAPDNSPFHEHLARRIAPAVREMRDLPAEVLEAASQLGNTVKKPSSGFLGGGNVRLGFPLRKYFADLATLLKSLSGQANDSSEPSLPMLATLLCDEEYQIVLQIANHYRGRNGYPETYITPAMPVLEEHPAVEFLGLLCRDNALSTPFALRLEEKTIPYNLLSTKSAGYSTDVFNSHSGSRYYSPYFFNHLYVDWENVRDMVGYHNKASAKAPRAYLFTVNLLQSLCPKNPYSASLRLSHGYNLSEEEMETIVKEFADFPNIASALVEYYKRQEQMEKILEFVGDDLTKLTPSVRDYIVDTYLERNEPDKAIEVLKRFLETEQSQQQLTPFRIQQNIGKILVQQGKFKEAEAYFVPAMQTYASWGLSGMARFYQEVVGNFDAAEELHIANERAYPRTGPFPLWAFRYVTNRPGLQESMDEILQRYVRYDEAFDTDRTERLDNETRVHQILYPCYCMDFPYPDSFGKDALVEGFLRTSSGILGFLAWFDAKENGNEEKAARLLRLLREQWFFVEKNDPFLAARQTSAPQTQTRSQINFAYQSLAALIEVDQRKETPGQLDQAEIDYLLRMNFQHDLSMGRAPWLLYLLGRYYDLCGEKNKAVDSYRRVLGFRVDSLQYDVQYRRCFAVKELRKSGLTNEEYVKWLQADPRIPRQQISRLTIDIMCRQHFRVYTESPSATVLERSAAAEPVAATDFGATTTRNPGWYKVTKVLFRGEAVPEDEMVVYWRVPEDSSGHWGTIGIATVNHYMARESPQRPDGIYPLQLGGREPVSAEASFHADNLVLTVWIKPGEDPVRIEMQKHNFDEN